MSQMYITGYDELGNPQYSDNPHDIPGYDGDNKYGFTSGGLGYVTGNDDSYLNAVNQQTLWNREDYLRKIAENREDFAMDRLFEASKRNGINPIFLLDAINSNTGSAASYSTSAAKANSYDTNARTDQATSAKIFGALLAALAMMAIKSVA